MRIKLVEFSLPCFGDSDIDGLLNVLPEDANISIRGVSGSGKTLVSENIMESALESGHACRFLIVGDQEDGRESLNQATGTGADLLSHIPEGTLAIEIVDEPGVHRMLHTLIAYESIDLLLIDSLDELENVSPTTAEQALFWLGKQLGTSVICISKDAVGAPRPYADLTIDMDRAGEEVELWNADSVLSVKADGDPVKRAFLVEGYGIRMWEIS